VNIRHLSVRQLQVFVAAVRAGNLSATARELHLTQPTVSLQIKRLSEVLGEKLLEQRDGRLLPTDAGAALYDAASDVLNRLEELGSTLDRVRSGEAGHISIGLVTTAKYVVPRILGAFARVYPQVQITLNIGNRAHVLQRFVQQADDLYLFSHPPSGEHVSATRIIKNPLQIIAPPDHWAAERRVLRFEELLGERFLIREPGSATRMMFEAWLSQEGLALRQTLQIESNEAIRLSVASGLGLSVISDHTLQEGRENFAVLQVAGFPLHSHWYLVEHEGRRLSHAAQRLRQFIGAHLQDCIRTDWIADAYTPGKPLVQALPTP